MAEFDEKLNTLLSNPESMAQILKLAQSLSGSEGAKAAEASAAAPPPPQPPPPPPAGGGMPSSSGMDILSSLTGGLDPQMLSRLLPLIQEFGNGQDTNARQLLFALRPYLKSERQEKVERALQLAKLAHIAKKFFAGWEG